MVASGVQACLRTALFGAFRRRLAIRSEEFCLLWALLAPTCVKYLLSSSLSSRRKVIGYFHEPAPGVPPEGGTPNALTISADRKQLFVAEADNNSIPSILLPARCAGASRPTGIRQPSRKSVHTF
jgi:hypothetical protein